MEMIKSYLISGIKNQELTAAAQKKAVSKSTYFENKSKGDFGEYLYSSVSTEHYCVACHSLRLSKKATLFIEYNENDVLMEFVMEGAAFVGLPFNCLLAKSQFNFFSSNDKKRTYQLKPSKLIRILTISFSATFLSVHGEYYAAASQFLAKINRSQSTCLSAIPAIADYKLKAMVIDLHTTMPGISKLPFAEAVIENILLTATDKLFRNAPPSGKKSRDSESIYLAGEDFILEPDNKYSIKSLARKLNMNPNKLKKQFKKEFDMPVIAVVRKMRLEKARQMILETTFSIQHIATVVGFNNPCHFSNAFKKKMGYPPSALRKK